MPLYLPIELWLYIAQFIPPHELPNLIGVNHIFFNLIMNELYNQLSFISADPRIFIDKLRSLQNPILSQRIRILTIWPGAIRDAINAVDPEKPKLDDPRLERSQTPQNRYLEKGRKYVGQILGHYNKGQPQRSQHVPLVPLASSEERLQMFHDVISSLTSVEVYEINWYFEKGTKDLAWTFPFFPIIWQKIGPNLRRLSIDAQLFQLDDIVHSSGELPRMEDLDLTLRSESAPVNSVVPFFINQFSRTLRKISIKTIGHQDLSLYFKNLGEFPLLSSFSLIMPLDVRHLEDPNDLRQFLIDNPSIRNLCIRYQPCDGQPLSDGFETVSGKHRIYSDISLPGLQSLELGLHIPFKAAVSNPMYYHVARLGSELNSLTLKDRSLSLEEVKTVLLWFPSTRLKHLSFYARYLSPQLIDYLALNCPNLNSLSLDVANVVKVEGVSSHKDDVKGFGIALFNYSVDLDNDNWRYRHWLLADISIMNWEFKVGHQYSWPCMKAIAAVVPSVRSFAGRGHMGEDDVAKPGEEKKLVDLGSRDKPLDT